MEVLALRIELYLRSARSLKGKRALLRPVTDGLRARFSLSVAEVDHHDAHHRAAVGVAVVAADVRHATEVADEVERWVWSRPDLEVVEVVRTWTEFD